ncbi:MAG: DUF5360 family protein [Litorimonas sp.]
MTLRRTLMTITDIGMLLYWSLTILMVIKLVDIPSEWLFKNYDDPKIIAWNWSFFPIDILLSVTGLVALKLEKNGNQLWRAWALVSLTLTVCAGLMAISFWAFVRDFDIAWWLPNLFLMLWPLPFIFKLTTDA